MTDEAAPTPNVTWPPDRKFIAGGIGAAVSWLVVYAAGYFGWVVPTEIQTAIPGVVAMALVYWVPPSMYDVVKRVNNLVVAMATRDMSNPTRAVPVPANVPMPVAQAAVNAVAVGNGDLR
jgi:hypothetical protein